MRSLDVVLSKGELEAHKVPGAAKRVAWVSEIKVGSVVSKVTCPCTAARRPKGPYALKFRGISSPVSSEGGRNGESWDSAEGSQGEMVDAFVNSRLSARATSSQFRSFSWQKYNPHCK
jgi:hypothetical protein